MKKITEQLGQRARMGWMDTARAMAILLVVLNHGTEILRIQFGMSLTFLARFNDAMAPFRIPTLIFLSGMLLHASLAKPAGVFLKGKVARIAWPYFVWSTILLGLTAAAAYITGGDGVDNSDVLQVVYNPELYLWYLAYLFVYYFIALFIPHKIRNVSVFLIIPLSLLASVALSDEERGRRFFFLLAIFFLGDICSRHMDIIIQILKRRTTLWSTLIVAIIVGYLSAAGWDIKYSPFWVIPTLAGIACAITLSQTVETWQFRSLTLIGRESLVFYTTHWAAMLVVAELAESAGIKGGALLSGIVLISGMTAGYMSVWLRRRSRAAQLLFELPILIPRRRTPRP